MRSTPNKSHGRRRSVRLRRKSLLVRDSKSTGGILSSETADFERYSGVSTNALRVELVPGDEHKTLEGLFSDVFDSAVLTKVDVEQCVSLSELRVRPLHNFGVQRAVHLLKGESIGSVTGYVCVGKFPVIAKLPAEYHSLILEYFCSKGRDREESMRFIQSRPMYHVVNGGYEHEGRWRLIESSGYQLTGIKWRTVLIPWQDPKVLRAIAMMSSQVQKQTHVVELSFLDEIVHLRRIMDDYILENGLILQPGKPLPRGFCKAIAKIFSGGKDYANNTLRLLISTSAKMSMRTALLMRKIIDEECPAIAKSVVGKSSNDVPFHLLDTRIFRTLINSKTLRGAKIFFAPKTSDEDRQNALYRLRYIAQDKGNYRGVDSSSVDTQVTCAVRARTALESFQVRIIGKDESMKPLIQNMLRTTNLDSEVEEYTDRPNELLFSLKLSYSECSGSDGGQKVEQYEKFVADQARKSINAPTEMSSGVSPDCDSATALEGTSHLVSDALLQNEELPEADDSVMEMRPKAVSGDSLSSVDPNRIDEVDQQTASDSAGANDTEPELQPEPEPETCPLERCGIEVYGLSWEDYNRTVLTEQEIFDLIISDPFQKSAAGSPPLIDSDRRANFVHFMKKVLVPGGYVFIIVPQREVASWLNTFEEFDLKPEGIFMLLKDPSRVQLVKGKRLQNLIEVAAVAQKGGRHPGKFVMDVLSPYTHLPRNRYNRKAPVIDNIAPPLNRLFFPGSRTMVRIGEKPPSLVWELLKTFCPPGGKVLDPFANTLTSGIASIQSGRSCVLLESDERCLKLAEDRLTDIARMRLEQERVGSGTLLEPACDDGENFGEPLESRQEGSNGTDAITSSPTNARNSSLEIADSQTANSDASDVDRSGTMQVSTQPAKETEAPEQYLTREPTAEPLTTEINERHPIDARESGDTNYLDEEDDTQNRSIQVPQSENTRSRKRKTQATRDSNSTSLTSKSSRPKRSRKGNVRYA